MVIGLKCLPWAWLAESEAWEWKITQRLTPQETCLCLYNVHLSTFILASFHVSPKLSGRNSYSWWHTALLLLLLVVWERHCCLPSLPWWLRQKNPPAMQETWVQSLGQEDSLEKGISTHCSIFAWRIPNGQWSLEGYSPWGCKESDTL